MPKIFLFFTLLLLTGCSVISELPQHVNAEQALVAEQEEPAFPIPEISTRHLSSETALLIDVETGTALLDINGSERMYPASMTKIMTALVAIEQLADLETGIYIDPAIFWPLQQANAAVAGFEPGSWVSAIDVLYGIMLPSGAEAALSMAQAVGGTVENFVQMMNEKAQSLGLVNTHFTNPIGLHDDDHYTTAQELVKLLTYALQNPLFKQLFSAQSHMTENGLFLSSTLFANVSSTELAHGQLLGGRTGFTLEAGRCLISLAEINGRPTILVTGGAPNEETNTTRHIADAFYLLNQLGGDY